MLCKHVDTSRVLQVIPHPERAGHSVRTYSCAEYGACTLISRVADTQCCNGCPDFANDKMPPARRTSLPCIHLGAPTGETRECDTCKGKYTEQLRTCAKYGVCTTERRVKTRDGKSFEAWCAKGFCESYSVGGAVHWAYGVTTVPSRADSLLPRTLASLKTAGFHKPRLFVDGHSDSAWWESKFGLPVTCRYPRVMTSANWYLSMVELVWREPKADMYAMFQDDFVTGRNLRAYLERCKYPAKGYWNLYTFPSNQGVCPRGYRGWYEARELGSGNVYHGKMQQSGKGAVALVFDRQALLTLLHSEHLRMRPFEVGGEKRIDGGIVNAMNKEGYREFVHNPSLVQHTGDKSTIGNLPHKKATSFMGEAYDLTELLK